METNIQIFQNNQFGEIRVTELNGEPMFCLIDLCKSLDLSNPRMVAQRLDSDEVRKLDLGGQIGKTNFVTESGMYTVILRSDSPKAKPMQKWVTSDILPSIRKHGAYITPVTIDNIIADPDFGIQLLTNLKAEQQKRIEAEQQIIELQPKAELMDKVMDCGELIDMGQAAKILRLPFGRNTLLKQLREAGIFFKSRNEPKQEYIQRGYFQLKEKWIERKNHTGFVVPKVLVTQSGLAFIDRMMKLAEN